MYKSTEEKLQSILDNFETADVLEEFIEYVNERAPELVEEYVHMRAREIDENSEPAGDSDIDINRELRDMEDRSKWSYKGVF